VVAEGIVTPLDLRSENMSEDSGKASGGIGFCGLLTIVLVTLKLIGKTSISWWWVFSPIWLPTIAFFAVASLVIICAMIMAVVKGEK
jgi:hypothetical protein